MATGALSSDLSIFTLYYSGKHFVVLFLAQLSQTAADK